MTDKIKVFAFTPGWDLPNISPFCMKLETYLRMANIPYELMPSSDPRKAPKGKLPWVEVDGKKIGDSTLIIDYLKKTRGDPIDKNLTKTQQAQAAAIQSLLEDHLYWVIMWTRWSEPTGWSYISQNLFKRIPWLLRRTICNKIRTLMQKQLHGHGMGRHTDQEIINFGKRDLDHLATLLGDKPFMLGDEPSSIDACAYAYIGAIWFTQWPSPLTNHLRQHENLLNYYQRMIQRYFPELPQKPKEDETLRKAA